MNNDLKRILSSMILAPIFLYAIYKGGYYFLTILIVIFLFGLREILKINLKYIQVILSLFLIAFLLCLFSIRELENGIFYVFFIVSITWLSDTGGYIFGKFLNGKKINIISPNKTYLGFFGSFIFSQISLVFLIFYGYRFYNEWIYNIFLIILFTLIVILGDLFFSFFKRKLEIKDYSMIIPGHGGVFDRLDGLIFLSIFFKFFLFFK